MTKPAESVATAADLLEEAASRRRCADGHRARAGADDGDRSGASRRHLPLFPDDDPFLTCFVLARAMSLGVIVVVVVLTMMRDFVPTLLHNLQLCAATPDSGTPRSPFVCWRYSSPR